MAATSSTAARFSPARSGGAAAHREDIRAKGIRAIASTSVFSPVDTKMEERAARILEEACPGARVVLSSQIGRLGLLERESAAILTPASSISPSARSMPSPRR